MKERYPVPGPAGGRLIREIIKSLRAAGLELPITSHIHIAVSGGLDSMALAHCLVRYGRRVGGQIGLLHVNHGWRAKHSNEDELFVRNHAKKWKVPVSVKRFSPPKAGSISWEEAARKQRKEFFAAQMKKRPGILLTAHHGDDLAETLLWRFCTGTFSYEQAGILALHNGEYRPLLSVRKSLLRDYLKEEGLRWREDHTNHEARFLRARLRTQLMPVLESIFPQAVKNLMQYASTTRENLASKSELKALARVAGLNLHRNNYDEFDIRMRRAKGKALSLPLTGGWVLSVNASRSEWKLSIPPSLR